MELPQTYTNQDAVFTYSTTPSTYVKAEPFTVYSDTHPLLSYRIPVFDFNNPPVNPIEFASRLRTTMKTYGGIGLSANQCGLPYRVFVMGTDEVSYTCFNPRIIGKSQSMVNDSEGCLSFPGLYLKVYRHESIEVEYQTEYGVTKRETLKGVTARCFQHELDHLDGIKFTEYVGPVAIHMAKKKQEKIMKKHARNKAKK